MRWGLFGLLEFKNLKGSVWDVVQGSMEESALEQDRWVERAIEFGAGVIGPLLLLLS